MSLERPSLATPYRTHTCGQLRASDAGDSARLAGWVHRRRDHGQLIFLDLRDRHGITQVVIDKADAPAAHATASRVRSEFVVIGRGEVAPRLPGTENTTLPTGEIELQATAFEILSEAKTPPFYINEPDAPVDEILRLKYRYLDIRREPMQRRLMLRSRMVQAIREVHHANGFVEVETPTLIKSTPEGARDFIVPSRLQPGSVYALPQSPQQLKQLLMVAGIDRYFQIARCYRDEDLRGDRQPEFTQLDLEMSFVDEATVMAFVEAMAIEVSRATVPERPILQVPFPVITYDEAIERFGSDKPDVRFGMELVDLATGARRRRVARRLGVPRVRRRARGGRPGQGASSRPGMGGITRREIDELTERARRFGAKGLAHLVARARRRDPRADRQVPVRRRRSARSSSAAGAAEGDLILIVADTPSVTADVLGRLRVELGERLGLADPNVLVLRLGQPLPDVPVGRRERALGRHPQPVQRRPARGRGAARDRLRRPGRPVARGPGRPGAGAPVRPRAQRLGARRRLGPDPPARPARALASCSRATRSRRCARSSGRSSTPSSTAPPPHGGIALGIDRWAALLRAPDEHPRGHGLPEDPVRQRPDARGAVAAGTRPVRGARAAVRRGCRASRPDDDGERGVDRRADLRSGEPSPSGSPARSPGSRSGRGSRRCSGRLCIAFSGIFYLNADGVALDRDGLPGALRAAAARRSSRSAERRRYGPLPAASRSGWRRSPACSSPAT